MEILRDLMVAALWTGAMAWSVARMASAWEHVTMLQRPSADAKSSLDVEVPEDLVAMAMQENESWAQEELMRVIRERYDTFHDWNRVRASMGIGIRNEES